MFKLSPFGRDSSLATLEIEPFETLILPMSILSSSIYWFSSWPKYIIRQLGYVDQNIPGHLFQSASPNVSCLRTASYYFEPCFICPSRFLFIVWHALGIASFGVPSACPSRPLLWPFRLVHFRHSLTFVVKSFQIFYENQQNY